MADLSRRAQQAEAAPASRGITAFAVFGIPFLVLHYRIHRKPGR